MQLSKALPLRPDQKSRLPAFKGAPAHGYATRILIIDEDRQVGVTLGFMLSARKFEEVRAVRSARRALAVAEQFRPEIVFLDFELPDGGAIALARSLAQDNRKPKPRLIALTADAAPLRESAKAAGFERCLAKPVSQEELDRILGISHS
jgi:CheY-like chemotaxis protein